MKEELKTHYKGFLFPMTSLEKWASIHDLSLEQVECPFCEERLSPDEPFATKTMRGIFYEQCQCDEYPKDQAPFMYSSSDPKERGEARRDAQSLYSEMSDGEGTLTTN